MSSLDLNRFKKEKVAGTCFQIDIKKHCKWPLSDAHTHLYKIFFDSWTVLAPSLSLDSDWSSLQKSQLERPKLWSCPLWGPGSAWRENCRNPSSISKWSKCRFDTLHASKFKIIGTIGQPQPAWHGQMLAMPLPAAWKNNPRRQLPCPASGTIENRYIYIYYIYIFAYLALQNYCRQNRKGCLNLSHANMYRKYDP